MRKFNLEEAQEGAELFCRDGSKAHFIAYCEEVSGGTELIVRVGKTIRLYNADGTYYGPHDEHEFDLFLVSKTITMWLNYYRGHHHSVAYTSKENADAGAGAARIGEAIKIQFTVDE